LLALRATFNFYIIGEKCFQILSLFVQLSFKEFHIRFFSYSLVCSVLKLFLISFIAVIYRIQVPTFLSTSNLFHFTWSLHDTKWNWNLLNIWTFESPVVVLCIGLQNNFESEKLFQDTAW